MHATMRAIGCEATERLQKRKPYYQTYRLQLTDSRLLINPSDVI